MRKSRIKKSRLSFLDFFGRRCDDEELKSSFKHLIAARRPCFARGALGIVEVSEKLLVVNVADRVVEVVPRCATD
jgi:hypothetical protein